MPSPGDVYYRQIEDGRYIAVRVLDAKDKSYSIASTPYLSDVVPQLGDVRLCQVLLKNRFRFSNEPAIVWLKGKPSPAFNYLGQIPLDGSEPKPKRESYGGAWTEDRAAEAFLEWRWEVDRAGFEEEEQRKLAELIKLRRLPQNPGLMVDEDRFWAIIERLDWSREGNDDAVIQPAIAALARWQEKDILGFDERLAYFLYNLDTRMHGERVREAPIGDEIGYLSADGFLYARCAVVANGREFYNLVLKSPSEMPSDLEFEALLSLAPTAYEKKTGQELDQSTGCSFESFSNAAGWSQ